ncbi:LysR family transcriptional regulator [Aestuariibacter sp. A3R04]|uniref:LysR family transcriptional regulator n=1 Tax=Aestuariibacter sp. A3R04 TaxID=2841571 RepID=UPI001C08E3FD|nr:LysR substrate-binding domain-containing protein [Aestuariibacter sp. A3R04]MBU3021093.1 LysR family transcriptional regulator [Aestuariibacter sp. A3R04]
MNLNISALRIFYSVAMEGSFTRAATTLCISQPGVSKGIKELEQQIGLCLIERSARSRTLRLTAAGESLFAHARSIFAIEKSAITEMQALVDITAGSLTIGASTTVAGYWLAPYIAEFKKQHAGISIDVIVGNTAHIEQKLLDAAIDIALVEGQPNQPSIKASPWKKDAMSLWTAPGQTFDPNQCTWLLREAGSGTRDVATSLIVKNNWKIKEEICIGSNEAIARAVASGLGVAFLPDVVCQELYELKRLIRIDMRTALHRNLYELTLEKRPLAPGARAFSNLLNSRAEIL